MTFPQLFYLGLLSGVLSKIPGLDLGTMLYVCFLNKELFSKTLRYSYSSLGIIFSGFLVTKFLPLLKMNMYIIHFSDYILAYFFGLVLFSSLIHWMDDNVKISLKNMILAAVILVLGILFKRFQLSVELIPHTAFSFVAGFLNLMPSVELMNGAVRWNFTAIILYPLGLLLGVATFYRCEKFLKNSPWIIASLLLVALIDLWPWRSFQIQPTTFLYGNVARDYPIFPDFSEVSLIGPLVAVSIGILTGWLIHKAQENRIKIIHDY